LFFFSYSSPAPPSPPLFPYTTLFRSVRPRILLDRIEEAVAHRLHAGSRVSRADTVARIGGFRRTRAFADWLQLAGKRQRLGDRHHLDRLGRLGRRSGRDLGRRRIVIGYGRRLG